MLGNCIDKFITTFWCNHLFNSLGNYSKSINARKQASVSENACHLFAEMDPSQPASAIVNFVEKTLAGHRQFGKLL